MDRRSPGGQVGFTAAQRTAMRVVEEEAVLELIGDFVRRADALAERLEIYASSPGRNTGEGPWKNDGP